VVTRPLGASFADWLGKPASAAGGLGLGDGAVTATGLVAFVVLVAWIQVTGHGEQAPVRLGRLGAEGSAA
jgi:uncharacterized membrane-anchored protein